MKNIIMTIVITLLLWLIIGDMAIVIDVDAFSICEATLGQIPDIYGQFNAIETPELLERKLEEFIYEINKIPLDQRKYEIEANERCPELITNDFKLMFLRCEVFNTDLAAIRYVKYWNKRVEIFGTHRAFQPLTLNSMTKDDIRAGEAGFANVILQDNDNDRAIFYIDPSKHTRINYNTENMIHIVWYMLHTILYESQYTQKHGMIFMGYPNHFMPSQFDRKLVQQIISSLQSCLPIRISVMHLCHPPSFFKVIWPIVSVFMSKRTKQRVQIHMGNQEEVLNVLISKYNMNIKYIPIDIGGGYIINPKNWLEKRQIAESDKFTI